MKPSPSILWTFVTFVAFAAYVVVIAVLAGRTPEAPATNASTPTLRELYGLPAVQSLDPRTTAVVLVDFQEEFVHGRLPLPDAPRAIAAAAELRAWARTNDVQVVHVQNVVTRADSALFAPGAPNTKIVPALTPAAGEHVVTKSSGGAFTKTDLDAWLRARHVDTIVVAGLMTHLAVQLTASDAAVLGYRVVVTSDATATRALPSPTTDRVIDHVALRDAALAAMSDRFATVLTVREVRALAASRP